MMNDISLNLSMNVTQNQLNLSSAGLNDHMGGDVSYLPVMDPTTIVLKGYLLKDNWYGNK